MKAITNITLGGFSLAAGVVGAVLAAPLFHQHTDPTVRLSAMWANNYDSLTEMSADVDAIVLGKIVQTVPGRVVAFADGRSALPFTYVDVAVSEVLRGQAPGYLTVEQTGGNFLGQGLFFDDDGGSYAPDEKVLLFLKEQPGTGLYYVAHPAGRFTVKENRLRAAQPTHPAAQALDRRGLRVAKQLIRN